MQAIPFAENNRISYAFPYLKNVLTRTIGQEISICTEKSRDQRSEDDGKVHSGSGCAEKNLAPVGSGRRFRDALFL